MEIGLTSFFDLMSLTLGMGLMRVIFHCLGKTCLDMQLFKIFVSGDVRLSATIFTNLTGMLSGPQEQSLLISLISLIGFNMFNLYSLKVFSSIYDPYQALLLPLKAIVSCISSLRSKRFRGIN